MRFLNYNTPQNAVTVGPQVIQPSSNFSAALNQNNNLSGILNPNNSIL